MPERVVFEAVAVAVVLLATVTDLLEHKIHNVLTGPAMLVGIVGHLLTGPWWEGLAGCFAVGAPFFVLYAFNVLKAGDVKLYMAIGALLGLKLGATAAFLSLVAWVPIGGAIVIVNGRLAHMRHMLRLDYKPILVPFGAAIAIGTLAALYVREI